MLVSAFALAPRTQLEADVRLLPLGTFLCRGRSVPEDSTGRGRVVTHLTCNTSPTSGSSSPPSPFAPRGRMDGCGSRGVSHQNTQQWRAARCLSPAHLDQIHLPPELCSTPAFWPVLQARAVCSGTHGSCQTKHSRLIPLSSSLSF